MDIVEKIIEIIQSRKYLTIAEKNELEMDIKFNREVESILQEKEVQIKELTEEIEKIEKKLEKVEKIKEAIENIILEKANRG